MSVLIVYDDTSPPSASLNGIIGAARFGEVVFRRQRLQDNARALAQTAGLTEFLVHARSEDRSALADQIRASNPDRIIHLPAFLPAVADEQALDRLQRLVLSPDPCWGCLGSESTSLVAMSSARYLDALSEGAITSSATPTGVAVHLEGAFADIRQPSALVDYLSGAFTSRHFNHVARENGVILKASSDTAKIRREHDYYHHLPPHMQRWFVMPYDLKVEAAGASYKLERLLALDVGQQWVNGALTPADFQMFLEDVFRFVDDRETRSVDFPSLAAEHQRLYVNKVFERFDTLKSLPLWPRLSGLFEQASGWSVPRLFDAYAELAAQPDRRGASLCIGHGDLCLSNILYDKRLRLLKLIDPRGALAADELYMDPIYDLAKLSHSILGGYDFIVNGLYDLVLDDKLHLRVFTPEANFGVYADLFVQELLVRGYDLQAVRIAEASLFLSMLPLHRDSARNMLAFLLIAKSIIEEVIRERAS